jgi:hypothetical protein
MRKFDFWKTDWFLGIAVAILILDIEFGTHA